MIGVVRVKEGVLFSIIAPGGFRILQAIEVSARHLGKDLWITSACDGEHSGPNDPHHRGEAYDVRSHDFEQAFKPVVLNAFLSILPADQFYCFLENPNLPTEHFHLQVRKGMSYP